MTVAAVAQNSEARTKNCQGSRLSSARGRRASVELSELIVEPLVDRGLRRRRAFGLALRAPRPLGGDEADEHNPGAGQPVRHQPGEAVEALVDRRGEELLAAVELDESGHDLVAILPLLDLFAQLITHLRRGAAGAL